MAINGRSAHGVNDAIESLGGGPDLVAAPGDLRSIAVCQTVVAQAVAALGGLGCLVNNTSICPLAYPEEVTEAHWDEVVQVNLRSAFFCSQTALPALREAQGNIIHIASIAGLCAGPTDSAVYAITKGGLVQMTRAMALELARDGVRVNCVCPGYINTPLCQIENEMTGGQIDRFVEAETPMKRIGAVEECVASILYFAWDRASYCTGSILSVDGGNAAAVSMGGRN